MATNPAEKTDNLQSQRSFWKRICLPWIYVLGVEAFVPVVTLFLVLILLVQSDQMREVLFGLIGPNLKSYSKLDYVTNQQNIGPPLIWFTFSICVFSLIISFSARILVNLDADLRLPIWLADRSSRKHLGNAVRFVPRSLGLLCIAALSAILISAESIRSQSLTMISLFLLPLPVIGFVIYLDWRRFQRYSVIAVIFVFRFDAKKYWRLKRPSSIEHKKLTRNRFVAFWVAVYATLWIVLSTNPARFSASLVSYFTFLGILPGIFLFASMRWRKIVWNVNKYAFGSTTPNETLSRDRVGALALAMFGVVVILFFIALSPDTLREVGTAAILLFSASAFLCLITALITLVRPIFAGVPVFFISFVVVCAIGLFAAKHFFAWSPLTEKFDAESVAVPQIEGSEGIQNIQHSDPLKRDVVINAYGGGLRAAITTAHILAELDDKSCGEFGKRINTISSVSGGSLGIGVYLSLRQEFVETGGWQRCEPSRINPPIFAKLVDDTLVRDFLSSVAARIVSTDWIPNVAPRRGQALYDGWQTSIRKEIDEIDAQHNFNKPITHGLAMPLIALNGGLSPAPTVFFNVTNAHSGSRVWLSNNGHWGDGEERNGDLSETFLVGDAVLDSARFPFVSPAAQVTLSRLKNPAVHMIVVDGGYAENSGAASLEDALQNNSAKIWININGNPTHSRCEKDEDEASLGMWSGLNALMAVRESQPDLAVRRLKKIHHDLDALTLTLDYDRAFEHFDKDPVSLCNLIKRFRVAPLGWYLAYDTVGDMHSAVFNSTMTACNKLFPICEQRKK